MEAGISQSCNSTLACGIKQRLLPTRRHLASSATVAAPEHTSTLSMLADNICAQPPMQSPVYPTPTITRPQGVSAITRILSAAALVHGDVSQNDKVDSKFMSNRIDEFSVVYLLLGEI